jgi:hypothetical protein
MKNKTLTTWLALFGGPLGLHRFYLYGLGDTLGWAMPIPTALGIYGIRRMQQYGVDDALSWVLIPLLGLTMAACALTAIVYGLTSAEKWNARFNADAALDAPQGQSSWLTILAVVAALLGGTTALTASMAFGFQHFFQYQVEEARKISQ